ncbi:MAG: sugar phosphate isomerase/epimerase [Lachnospiraceae bacterium]|nr:sugar phosphate isomerase/epimerase [Lachnospiraceae bacterium]
MQLGIRLHDTKVCPIEERLGIVREQGFSCVHMALSKTEGLHYEDAALTPGYAMYLKHIFQQAKVDIAVLGNYLNLGHPDFREMVKIRKKYTAHLRFAALLGCGMVGTETGAPNKDYHYDKEACHSREALELFINNIRPVVKDAENLGVILAIEPVYRHIVWNPGRAREVLDRIGSPNLQIIFDPVNLLDPDNVDHKDEVIEEAMELLCDDIAMVHLKDYVIENGNLRGVGCGEGEMDYSAIVGFMKEKKPFIQATLEETRPETAVFSKNVIEQL